MPIKNARGQGVLFFFLGCLAISAAAAELSTQEILDQLKSHQDQIKSIQADFSMTVFGMGDFKLDQSGTCDYTPSDLATHENSKEDHNA